MHGTRLPGWALRCSTECGWQPSQQPGTCLVKLRAAAAGVCGVFLLCVYALATACHALLGCGALAQSAVHDRGCCNAAIFCETLHPSAAVAVLLGWQQQQ